MKAVITIVAMVMISAPGIAQDGKYNGTGMSVTGPASEKKPSTTPTDAVKASAPVTPLDKAQPGSNGTSAEETNGTNSAVSNSH
jgi:hypothetical protein